jgi:phosphoglucomutase
MKCYQFTTTATLKDKDAGKFWLNQDFIGTIEVRAESVQDALSEYVGTLSDIYSVDVSKTAIRHKRAMLIDTESGETVQMGYILNCKCVLEHTGDHELVNKNIDLWVKILEVTIPDFGKHA